ncbi:MAG: pyridoxamine 5'-phosphate oxidase family protein [Boseongicola sp. SB0664_bin_43]|uniref:Pyridoxamine 5'-phosphate oxidase family protein n=1 Tax=Boseongicola sp. SB0664_bin_43 TaxID=2604844 RepID=A0A6B0XZM0_9RHOB|nr:pyridoxamine 5'-phosphate oxidase family protein [Boseongicola sp. SB0664_bin_43]
MPIGTKLNRSFRAFIERQPVFFVATAAPEGRVNVSPKGMGMLKILSDTHLRWLNLSGSGNETAAHLRLSDRMTLMFCAFEGDALILRVYGTAKATHPRESGWAEKASAFPDLAGSRQLIDMEIDMVQTSCGSGVPLMELKDQRGPVELVPYFDEMGPDGVAAFWRRKNTRSIDGYETGIFGDD